MTLWQRFTAWLAYWIPADEDMEIPLNDKALRGRVGREHHPQSPPRELHTTGSPINRRGGMVQS